MSGLLKLAEACEARGAGENQRALLADAAYALWGDEADATDKAAFWDRATRFVAKLRAEAFESAAFMLLPLGGEIAMLDLTVSWEADQAAWPAASLRWYPPHKNGNEWHAQVSGAPTIALAIAATALRAKARVEA